LRRPFLGEPVLEIETGEDRLPRRPEDCQGLVAAQLDHRAAVPSNALVDELREASHEAGGRLVTVLVRETCVPADVRDQKGLDAPPRLGLVETEIRAARVGELVGHVPEVSCARGQGASGAGMRGRRRVAALRRDPPLIAQACASCGKRSGSASMRTELRGSW
jgi:hypothetical protein